MNRLVKNRWFALFELVLACTVGLTYQDRPTHWGIAKTLGYGYLWSGDLENSQRYLARFGEIKGELDAYIWHWRNLGREDLSSMAVQLKARLATE